MARKTIIVLEDDLTGTVLDQGRGETVSFGLDGQQYEIDLSGDNARQFRDALKRYTSAGRKQSPSRPGAARSSAPSRRKTAQDHPTAIRNWAEPQGYQVGERGRLPQAVVDAYAQSS